MARIEGVYLPNDKRVIIGLTYLYGIGLPTSEKILKATNISPDIRVKDLTHEQVALLQKEITTHYEVEGELRKRVIMAISRLQQNGSYRGTRHKKSLPARGQRTKTNARTRKGPRKASGIVPNKKIASKK